MSTRFAPRSSKMFDDELERSEAADNTYKKWTNRYTLTKPGNSAAAFASCKNTAQQQGDWQKNDDVRAARMYVMDESFKPNKDDFDVIRTGRRDNKGLETWTLDTDEGKKLAEENVHDRRHDATQDRAAVLARDLSRRQQARHHDLRPGDFLQRQRADSRPTRGRSRKRSPSSAGTRSTGARRRPCPNGARPATVSDNAKWPWDIFDADEELAKNAAVKLNWQAKLMPVTSSRLTARRRRLP